LRRIVEATLLLASLFFLSPALSQEPDRQTFTREEVQQLSPQETGRRILPALADQVETARITHIGGCALCWTPPWLTAVSLEMRPRVMNTLCQRDVLTVTFAPIAPTDQSRHTDRQYDPPTVVTGLLFRSWFADPQALHRPSPQAACPGPIRPPYFLAADSLAAAEALRAFQQFRAAAGRGDTTRFSCRDLSRRSGRCRNRLAEIVGVTEFYEVLSVEDLDERIIVLALHGERQLRLSVQYDHATLRLARAQLVKLVPQPPI
jgi:hypothetical protein